MNKQIQEICQFIQMGNSNLQNSEKLLKQPEKHSQAIWEIIVKLVSKLRNKNIQNAYAQMVFMLQDGDRHQTSTKWLKQFMDVHDLAIKISSNYTVNDFLKPDKEKVIPLIHKIIEVSKGVEKLKQSFDQMITKDQILSKQLKKQNLLQQDTALELQKLKQRKASQLTLYQQKVKIIQSLAQQTNYKKNQKLDIVSSLKLLNDQISQKQKQLQRHKYQNECHLITIDQLKKEITLNAPEVKKQKRAIQQEYSKLSRDFYEQNQTKKKRQLNAKANLDIRNKYKDELVNNAKKIIQMIHNNDQQRVKLNKFKQENQRLNRRKRQLIHKQNQIKDEIKSFQIQFYNEDMMGQNDRKDLNRNQDRNRQISFYLHKFKNTNKDNRTKFQNLEQFNKDIKLSIQEIKHKVQDQVQERKKIRQLWYNRLNCYAQQALSPFQNYQSPQ